MPTAWSQVTADMTSGCDGIIHTASPLTMDPNPHNVIPQAISFTVAVLEAAAATPSVKRFVFTSSSATAKTVGPQGPDVQITPESWYLIQFSQCTRAQNTVFKIRNDTVLENVWAPPPYGPERIEPSYQASKVLAEREMWKFMRERKPHFVANSVLPDYVIGAPLSVQHQGFANSTVMLLKTLMDNRDGWQITGAQYMIDAGDSGRLHLAALIKPDVVGERVPGFAHPKTWSDWISRLQSFYPGRARKRILDTFWEKYADVLFTVPMPPPDEGRDESTVTARPRSEAMLKWLGQSGWRPMEESLKETTDLMVENE